MIKSDLHDCLFFKGVDEQYIEDFLDSCEIVEISKDTFLFHQNEIGDSMFIIEQGELEMTLEQNAEGIALPEVHVLGVFKSKGLVGQLCVFGQQKRSASIRALTDARLLKVEGEDFRIRIYSKDLDALLISYNIAKILSNHLITLLNFRASQDA